MPLRGFVDDTGRPVSWQELRDGGGRFACPRPVLLALAKSASAEHDYADLTASAIAGGLVRQRELMRRCDYYESWQAHYYAWLGSAAHTVVESAARSAFGVGEATVVVAHRSGLTIGGRFDWLEIDPHAKKARLYDYKTVTVYAVRQVLANGVRAEKPEWVTQLNIYRWLIDRAVGGMSVRFDYRHHSVGFDHIVAPCNLYIVALARDWTPAKAEALPVELIAVPVLADSEIEAVVDAAVADLLAVQAITDSNLLPPCPTDRLWFNERTGIVQRCANYCPVSDWCNQWAYTKRLIAESGTGRATAAMLDEAAIQIGRK